MGRITKRNENNNALKTLWTAVVAVFTVLLLLLTIGIVALRIGNTLPENKDIIFIVGKNPGSHFEDGEGVWEAHQEVSIFQSQYVNGENQTTVISQEGDKIIAPGVVSTYSFCMYNDGNMALAYDFSFSFVLTIAGIDTDAGAFPMFIRMTDTRGEYVIGGESEWVRLSSENLGECKGVLGAKSYEQFNLEIMWAFEGNDELDTALGNESTKSDVDLTFHINSYAEEHSDSTAQGGVPIMGDDYDQMEYGGTIRWKWFLVVLALLAICVFYLIFSRD
ncbi:MAG: hypothetical protein J6A24_00210 [Clostridia bacterium]|nr:hypothetical protein [Clostridia bacterium]